MSALRLERAQLLSKLEFGTTRPWEISAIDLDNVMCWFCRCNVGLERDGNQDA